MRIDQRNAGASVSIAANNSPYTIDRFQITQNGSVASTVQRSTVVPAGQGFTNSLFTTVATAEPAVATGNKTYGYYYKLEGFSTSDLGWGTASAQTITISFWVRSSVAGTYSFSVMNSSFTRSYNTSYAITAANTWEKKIITITGDTGATAIDTTNGTSIALVFDLGFSTMYETATANTWLSSGLYALSGCVKLSSTVGATFYLTGLQLEAGSTATEFERRSYGTELALCQRYYEITTSLMSTSAWTALINVVFWKVDKRVTPTVLTATSDSGGSGVTFAALSTHSAYQGTGNSIIGSCTVRGGSEL
jgi:hypothetical protein